MSSEFETFEDSAVKVRLLILGSGTSHGVPMIGCDCEVCTSDDPRDKRNRSSAVISTIDSAGRPLSSLLIDTTPELRTAAIDYKLRRVDAVAITHAHADHILGMDDLRRFNNLMAKRISVYADQRAIAKIRNVFGYAERLYENPDRPALEFVTIESPFTAAAMPVIPVPVIHGKQTIYGYRIGPVAYLTDCSEIPPQSMEMLKGLKLLVINALRHNPHPAHFSLTQALAAIEQIAPERALLTHIAHQLGHEQTSKLLPKSVELAYDGLQIDIDRT